MNNQFTDPFAEVEDNNYDFEETTNVSVAKDPVEAPSSLGSRTAPRTQFEQIAKRRITWKSNKKGFESYNLETKENKIVPNNIEFIPLVSTASVTGSHPMGKKGTPSEHYNNIFSNEITSFTDDLIIVKERDAFEDTTTEICRGYYSAEMTDKDGKVLPSVRSVIANIPYANYTINVYALVRGTDEVVKFAFSKSSRNAGHEINKNITGKAFKLNEAKEVNNGGIVYYEPVIGFVDITPEEDSNATNVAIQVEEKIRKNKSRVQ